MSIYESIQNHNTYYTDKKSLQDFILDHNIDNSPSLLIQIFSGDTDQLFIATLLSELTDLLPTAMIIGTTTDGEIMNGKVSSEKVVLSFTQFEHTTLRYAVMTHQENDSFETGRHLAQRLMGEDTKLILSFADGLHTNGEEFLKGIASVNDKVIVAGGLAGDNFKFEKTLVFTKDEIVENGAVAVALDSQYLHIHTDYSFNWQPIGNEMTVTKVEQNRLYTLNDIKVVDIYSHYLGIEPEQFKTGTGIDFPLIVNHNDLNIARAIISKEDDGSVIMAGNLSVGDKVRIGFGDAKGIINQSQKIIETVSEKPSEVIFVYSCTARRYFMGEEIETEIFPLQAIAPVSGFFTYGEFFTSKKNELLNETMTIVSLSESIRVKKIEQTPTIKSEKIRSDYFSALVHLINATSQEVQEYTDALQQSNAFNEMLKERMELALYGSNDGVWDWNVPENSVYFSPRWKEIIGYKDHEFTNLVTTLQEHIHPDDLEQVWKNINKNLYKKTEYFETIHRLRHKDGHWVWVLVRGKTLFDKNDQPLRMIGTMTDITEQKMLQLRAQAQQFVIEQINDGVIRTDMEGNIISWNYGAEKIYGYSEKEVVGKHISIIFHPENDTSFQKFVNTLQAEGTFSMEERFITKSREEIYVSLSLTLLRDEKGTPIGLISINKDITETKEAETLLKKQKAELHHQAHYDTLTGLPNRALFMDRMEQALIKARRSGSKVALFFIDLDKFKHINDSFGHLVGDKVLQIIAERLGNLIRKGDTLARLSGDEFTMIIEDVSDGEHLATLAQKLLEHMKEPIYIDEFQLYLSLSIGISIYPDDARTALELLKYADTAMYKAKESGRNTFEFYAAEMTSHALARMILKTSLKQAIEKDEFVVYYQPQIDIVKNKIIGLEALVRWKNPEKGFILPGAFLSLAVETGMVVEIDKLVIEKALSQVSQWSKKGILTGTVALNLTTKQLEYQDFVEELSTTIKRYDIDPANLVLELSEAHMMKGLEYTTEKVKELNALGVHVSIDDFGTGCSSLSFLTRLSIHQLKIDQAFVSDIPEKKESIEIIKAIIALAKSLHIDMIAEGVETLEQKEFLLALGCEKMQGNYFGEPLPAQEVEILLNKYL
ncbi:EAL domain-containing protein [Sulfurovum sp. zt1-1]|uniref:EAL domain-containing protein n=1 Tax=Sulfurovum zhangzhouensis TaxID=3019067 RepID=A0ABT7QYG7_9BACT|nr:EAL domain-containing protein [Sulfurovum zhangzhouensis]MDM5271887.1 EAL domain-containing protein [Sulfurovum zhangzhouensis]